MSEVKPTVLVAMSGGVDSSVAAALLVQQGYRVIGAMLRLWAAPGPQAENACCTLEAADLARVVARQLGIPFHTLDAREAFRAQVVEPFLEAHAQARTPNPCLWCNRRVRWAHLWAFAQEVGADYIATGHYARLRRLPDGPVQLLRGLDEHKDQSYVLSMLPQAYLQHTLLPLGEYTKPEVRRLAAEFRLPVAQRPDSQDLCFLGGYDYRTFLERYRPELVQPGPILSPDGQRLGTHQGLAFYTIGQRRGLGVAAPEPLYVLAKDVQRNALIVGPARALGFRALEAYQVNWVAGHPPSEPTFRAQVKIRYKARPAPATITLLDEHTFRAEFDEPLRDITPGQAAVVYQGDLCLGGGWILHTE